MNSLSLPDFTEHQQDRKNHHFDTPNIPAEHIRLFLDRQSAGSAGANLRVLDVGCGRGDTVAWMRAQGWDAYGIDVDADYIARGRDHLSAAGDDPGRLQLIGQDFSYPFDDEFFDVVLSDQVIEHVVDLDCFASEVARVSAPSARGLHIYPAKWCPIEPHLMTPFTHWLPKGRLRRAVEGAWLRVGVAAPYFTEYSFAERLEIYNRFSEEHTFYRPLRETIKTMARHGLDCDVLTPSRDRVSIRVPSVHGPALSFLGLVCRHAHSVALYTVKRESGNHG